MILFLDDWKKYPSAIINLETTNETWIKIVSIYKEMGIRNHAFPLALVDRTLVGVDPFDPEISLENQLRVSAECKINPWYYFREIARVGGGSGEVADKFQANRGNISLFWCFFNHITYMLIQIRQTGKSFSTDTLMTYLLNIRCVNTEINLLTKDDTLRSANLARLKDIDEELPFYLKQRGKGDISNTEELSVKSLGNKYRGHLPQKSPKMALNVGRGLTSPIFQIDEAPFQSNIEISMPAALAAGTAARDRADREGDPWGTILTTTAGKKDDKDGKYIYNWMLEAAEWSERLLDCKDRADLEDTIRRNSRSGTLRINGTFNHLQLGKDDAWLKKALEDSGAVGEAADRDFFNIWTSGTQLSPLSTEVLEKIRKSYMAPLYNSISKIGGYITRWYIPEDKVETVMRTRKTIATLDTSDASGGDDISLIIQDVESGETLGAGTFNETNLIKFAQWLAYEWIVKYENLTMLIERRSSGVAILDYLLYILPNENIDPFKRLFNTIVQNAGEDPQRYNEICQPLFRRSSDIYEKYKKAFGFATSGSGMTSRTELYSSILRGMASNIGDRIRDLTTINQITGLVIKNGRVDHQDGEHDDMCIAMLLAYWFLTQGKHLNHYGINSKMIYTHLNTSMNVKLNPYEEYQLAQQQSIRLQIDQLLGELKSVKDEFIGAKIEKQIRALNSNIILQENEKFSVDELINSIKDAKRERTTRNYFNRNNDSYGQMMGISAPIDPTRIFFN